MVTKTIICLANSFRRGGSCIAGVEVSDGLIGGWIRPISHREDQAINPLEQTYPDNTRVAVLDVVQIEFDEPRPEGHQTENWLITNGVRWTRVGQATPDQLDGVVLPADTPLWRPAQSTYNGVNDQIRAPVAQRFDSSLALIQPASATVEVIFNPFGDKNEVWVSFTWAGRRHKIKLTDPVYFAHFNTKAGDSQTIENPMLCISLAHVWEQSGMASKLVAGLIM